MGVAAPVEQRWWGGQGEHSDWSERLVALLKLPLSHGSGAEAPGRQMEPGSHGTQAVALGEDWYVPPSHVSHSPLPSRAANEPGAHIRHDCLLCAPICRLCVPTGHS